MLPSSDAALLRSPLLRSPLLRPPLVDSLPYKAKPNLRDQSMLLFIVVGGINILEMDLQANGTTRAFGPLEKDKDMLKAINGSAAQLTENDGAFSVVLDGWERSKLKKRFIIKSDTSLS